ncbi:hypothetical protein HGM15179_005305 [Zosterops borbonicus]|uniref:Metallophosphoesterase 1 n=1 Tax=Zosterops borbonicus TaxID=364589 RepID=A0A8K1GNJ3_9PASS|nr:hypothetical protein HGM15179_005305 [Zosterops borbonicus]
MALPVVHRCLQLTDENEQLVKKVKKLHIKNKELEKNLGQIQEQLYLQQIMRVCGTSRDVQVQTETHLWHKGGDSKDLVLESDSVRLLQMYNELQKRYVKETKTNKEQSEAIKNLTIKISELEHNLQEQRQRIEQLECKKVSWKTGAISGKRSQTPEGGGTSHRDMSAKEESCCSNYLELLLKEIKKLKKENGKLSAEKKALKNELAGLDKDFFEEVEDLKRAVQESVKLNNEYEKCLKQISDFFEEVEDLKRAVQESVKLNNEYEKCLKQISLADTSALILPPYEIYKQGVVILFASADVKGGAHMSEKETSASVLKAIILADTHLLGEIKGHWLDKLRREWQMERSFQTALWLLQPDIVFILGDVFDEGKWSSPQAWADDVRRFGKMFRHSVSTELVVIAGNHDIGFHYEMTTYKVNRFEKLFNFTSGKLITRKGINFVLVNSVAMEGDGCAVCQTSEAKLVALSHKLNCSQQKANHSNKRCSDVEKLPASEPILLQHYPLYRKSDAECTGEDSAPPEEKNIPFKEKYDVLSQEASQKLVPSTTRYGLFSPLEKALVLGNWPQPLPPNRDLEIGDLTAVVFTPDSESTVTQQSDSLHFFSRAA